MNGIMAAYYHRFAFWLLLFLLLWVSVDIAVIMLAPTCTVCGYLVTAA
jgi:hypothetical protein